MLTSPRIAGLRGHNGDIYPAVWRGILDVDTWEALRERLSRNGGGTNQVRHPFTGLVRCERCGASMTIKRASGKPRYACPTREGGRGCGSIAIRQDELDALLTETLLRQVEDVDLGDADQGDDAALLADEIARLEAKLAALAEVFAEDGLSAVEYRAAARKVRTKIEAAQADLARRSRRRAIMPEVSVLRRDWLAGSLSIRDRRELARTFIDRVEIGPARRGYNRFDPSRVTLHWR